MSPLHLVRRSNLRSGWNFSYIGYKFSYSIFILSIYLICVLDFLWPLNNIYSSKLNNTIQYLFMVCSRYFLRISQPRKDLVLSLQLQQGQQISLFQLMNISQTVHLFCPSRYLDGLSGFLFALNLKHTPLQPISTQTIELI